MLHHLFVNMDHDGAPGAGGGKGECQPGECGQHLYVQQLWVAAGKPDNVHRHPFRQARPVHRHTQSEDTHQEIGDGLGEAVEGHADIVHGVYQHQYDDAHHAGHGDMQGFCRPQHHRHGHHGQCPLPLVCESVWIGGQNHRKKNGEGETDAKRQNAWSYISNGDSIDQFGYSAKRRRCNLIFLGPKSGNQSGPAVDSAVPSSL